MQLSDVKLPSDQYKATIAVKKAVEKAIRTGVHPDLVRTEMQISYEHALNEKRK